MPGIFNPTFTPYSEGLIQKNVHNRWSDVLFYILALIAETIPNQSVWNKLSYKNSLIVQ